MPKEKKKSPNGEKINPLELPEEVDSLEEVETPTKKISPVEVEEIIKQAEEDPDLQLEMRSPDDAFDK